jgi:hypothetical protein
MDANSSTADAAEGEDVDHVIYVIHGIRDYGAWQSAIQNALSGHGRRVIPIKYGRYCSVENPSPEDHHVMGDGP